MKTRPLVTFCLGSALGLIVGAAAVVFFTTIRSSAPETPKLVVRLHKVGIRADQLAGYGQWQAFLHARHDDAVKTLEREHMFVEAMFRNPDDPRTLYWLEVRDDQGAPVESSTDDLDVQHQRFMDQVLQPGTWSLMTTDNVLVAPFIDRAIDGHRHDFLARSYR